MRKLRLLPFLSRFIKIKMYFWIIREKNMYSLLQIITFREQLIYLIFLIFLQVSFKQVDEEN